MSQHKNLAVAIAGVSASGKTTISTCLSSVGFKVLRSVTTRPPRHLESDADYEFVSHDKFTQLRSEGLLAEYQKFGAHWYGLRWTELETEGHSVGVMTVGGIQQILSVKDREDMNFEMVNVFLNCSRRTMLRRMRGRGDSWRHIMRRLLLATFDRRAARKAGIEFVDAEQPILDINQMVKLKIGISDPEMLMLWV